MAKELKIGILAAVVIVLFYFGMSFLKGSDVLSSSKKYYAVYSNIDGLATSNRVMVNGYAIGLVSDIRVLSRPKNPILVEVTINSKVRIGKQTVAVLGDDGLVGGKIINLDIDALGTEAAEGDTLATAVESGLMAMLSEKAGPLTQSLDTTFAQLNALLREYQGTSEKVNALLESADQTSRTFNAVLQQNQTSLQTISTNLAQLSTQLIETEKQLTPLLEKAAVMTDSINALPLGSLMARTETSLEAVNQTLNLLQSGQGSAGKLLTEDSLYQSLQQTLIDLDKLLVNFREQPKRYVHFSVFGKRDKPEKKP
ncbi:MAG: MlaD family protein [Bernardetiaceae bacterium]